MASRILRARVRSLVRKAVFTYCWVMVEPPCWDALVPDTCAQPARAMPAGSTPLWFQKFWSSAAITALIRTRGIRR